MNVSQGGSGTEVPSSLKFKGRKPGGRGEGSTNRCEQRAALQGVNHVFIGRTDNTPKRIRTITRQYINNCTVV